MVIAGLSRLLEPDYELAGTAENGQVLLDRVTDLKPDVIVVDISMPLLNGIEALRQLKKAGSDAKVIILTMHSDVGLATEAIQAGASGYLLKQSAAEELTTAIKEALRGRTYITPVIAQDVLDALMKGGGKSSDSPAVKLTPRERQVLQLIAEGNTAKEIAAILNVSTRTAEFHKYNVQDKLGLKTTAELTQYAVRHHLITS
jgi:DNA-binding NarL/FixJ family response regulator